MVRNAQEDNLAIYVNGCLYSIGENQLVGNTISNDFVSIGAFIDDLQSLYHFFCGKIDDVRIYNRALCPEEILSLFSPGNTNYFIEGESEVCQGQKNVGFYVQPIYCATTYIWNYSGNGATISGSSNSLLIDFANDASSGNLSVTARNNNIDIQSLSIPIEVNPLPLIAGTISGDNEVCTGQNGVAYIVQPIDNATSYIWNYSGTGASITGSSNNISVDFADSAINGSLIVAGYNSCGTGTISDDFSIAVNSCIDNPDIINIPNSFSPNGDGINDFFIITGLTENSKLIIFDRSGKKLYESVNYQNDWDGKDNNGNALESDTYWYVINMAGIPSEFKGFVYLKR
jgi:gliding motility-associated-like protein